MQNLLEKFLHKLTYPNLYAPIPNNSKLTMSDKLSDVFKYLKGRIEQKGMIFHG